MKTRKGRAFLDREDFAEPFGDHDNWAEFLESEIRQSEKRFLTIKRWTKGVIHKTGKSGTRSSSKDTKTRNSCATRYPKRDVPKTDYSAIEVPDDDWYLHCEECNIEHLGDCPVHGPLIVVEDFKTEPGDELRANNSCPVGLTIRESKIPAAGYGVWSTKAFPKGVRFGPFVGDIKHNVGVVHASGYGWQIVKNDKTCYYVDAKDVSKSNWMRYVNCTRHNSEMNLLAFQYRGGIYYKTLVPIKPNEELLVWYGDEYAEALGIIDDKQLTIWQQCKNPDSTGYECDNCDMMFSHEEYLLVHKWTKHGVPLSLDFMCKVCSKRFPTQTRLDEHFWRIHESKVVKDENAVANDESERNDEKMFCCPVCRIGCRSRSSLSVHMRQHNEKGNHNCNVCGKGFRERRGLSRHMKIHAGKKTCVGKKTHVCSDFGKGFIGKGKHTKCARIHFREKPHSCKVCGKQFTRSDQLTRHVTVHTGDRPYSCNVCLKQYTRPDILKRHMMVHSGDRPYSCNVCGKGFICTDHLTRHMIIHSGEKPYVCNVCGRAFGRSGHLTRHMMLHSGEKPHVCNVCGKGFADSSYLVRHWKVHSGDKPYPCYVCGKGFAQQGNLTTHMRIHSGEKPFVCKVCGKGCTQLANLTSHMRTHREEKPPISVVRGKRIKHQKSRKQLVKTRY